MFRDRGQSSASVAQVRGLATLLSESFSGDQHCFWLSSWFRLHASDVPHRLGNIPTIVNCFPIVLVENNREEPSILEVCAQLLVTGWEGEQHINIRANARRR